MTDWHEDDAFWHDTETVLFNEECLQRTSAEVDQILKLTDPSPGAAVLDLGCGPGRHALEFARRGFRVSGVDRTARYLQAARAKAEDAGLDIEWVQADMREYSRPGAFDLAISLYTTFGYFSDPKDDARVAGNLWTSLNPGGQLVMELMSKEILARIFQKRDWREEADGTLLLEERTVQENWGRIQARWIVIQGAERREHVFSTRLYSAVELSRVLAGAGFANIRIYGSIEGAAYDHEAQRLVAVAQRPE